MGSIWKAGNFIRSKNYIVFMHFLQNHSSRSSALQPSTLANANKLPALALPAVHTAESFVVLLLIFQIALFAKGQLLCVQSVILLLCFYVSV